MKIFTVDQIRAWDSFSVEEQGIESYELMERAAKSCVSWIINDLKPQAEKPFVVFCGTGNNGGDGLAIARLLKEKGFNVLCFVIPGKKSADFTRNEGLLTGINYINNASELPDLKGAYIIDSVLGTGTSRPLEGLFKETVDHINKSKRQGCEIISIDTPTGLWADKLSDGSVIHADFTLTFGSVKKSFLFMESERFVGEWKVMDIGLSKSFIVKIHATSHFITSSDMRILLKPLKRFQTKWDNGHALLVGGSWGKAGAMVLSANGCKYAGTGLVTVCVPDHIIPVIQQSVPEAMAFSKGESIFTGSLSYDELARFNAVAVGPGMGTSEGAVALLKNLLQFVKGPMVIDADALNILAENKTWLSHLPSGSVLTPHVKEFERLTGKKYANSFERADAALYFAQKHNIYLVLKGSHTMIACPDGISYFNSTGNPGMAKAGCGDTLTGVICGLIAQGYSSKDASIIGVFIHGLAADIIAEEEGFYGVHASRIAETLPKTFHLLTSI